MHYKIPLVLSPQPEGGFTVTSPLLPELVTEGDTAEEAMDNVRDALAAVHRSVPGPRPDITVRTPLGGRGQSRVDRNGGGGAMRYRDAARKLAALGCHELPRKGAGSHRK
jgi:predicted RNase H-like HicB family nuclease